MAVERRACPGAEPLVTRAWWRWQTMKAAYTRERARRRSLLFERRRLVAEIEKASVAREARAKVLQESKELAATSEEKERPSLSPQNPYAFFLPGRLQRSHEQRCAGRLC